MLPKEYQLATNADLFLVFDSGIGDPERIFIFASDLGLQFLYECDHWYADGTFKVCREVFYQVYTVHGQQRTRNFPCVLGLLPNKAEATYTRFFRELFIRLENLENRNPDDILVDFERAAVNSIHNLNPQIEVKGCFYHFSSNVCKRIQNVGLQHRYNNDQELASQLRMLPAIAFLPAADVIQDFEELVDEIRNIYNDEVDELLD